MTKKRGGYRMEILVEIYFTGIENVTVKANKLRKAIKSSFKKDRGRLDHISYVRADSKVIKRTVGLMATISLVEFTKYDKRRLEHYLKEVGIGRFYIKEVYPIGYVESAASQALAIQTAINEVGAELLEECKIDSFLEKSYTAIDLHDVVEKIREKIRGG